MKAALLTVGTEILFGQVVNTNAAYLSRELNEMGIGVMYHYTMGDNPGRLRRILEFALEEMDKQAGKQLDPQLTPVFVRLIRSRSIPLSPQAAARRK